MTIRVKNVVAASVVLIGGLVAANSVPAQCVPPYWNPTSFPPTSGGRYVTPYPHSWPWYGSYGRTYGWNRVYRFSGYGYHRGPRYHYGYDHYRSAHSGHRARYVGRR